MNLIFNHPYVGVVFLGALKDVSFTKSPIHIVPILKINVSKHKNKQDINNCTKVRTLKKQVKIINRAAQLMIWFLIESFLICTRKAVVWQLAD